MIMKRFGIILLATFMVSTLVVNAQGPRFRATAGNGNGYGNGTRCAMLNLTADQQKQIDALRVKHIKEVTPLQNDLREMHAKLITLRTAEKPDLNAINSLIDQISSTKATLMKKRVAHRAEVSALLTAEQRVIFNSHSRMGRGRGMGRGMGRGRGMRRGRGMGMCRYGY